MDVQQPDPDQLPSVDDVPAPVDSQKPRPPDANTNRKPGFLSRTLSDGTQRFLDSMSSKKSGLLTNISSTMDSVTGSIGGTFGTVSGSVQNAVGAVGGSVHSAVDVVGGTVHSAYDVVGGTVHSAYDVVGGTVHSAYDAVGGTVTQTLDTITGKRSDSQDISDGKGEYSTDGEDMPRTRPKDRDSASLSNYYNPDDPEGSRRRKSSGSSDDEPFGGEMIERSESMQSWDSQEEQPDEFHRECVEFMRVFVQQVFKESDDIPQEMKAHFGELCQSQTGRLWFARFISRQRVNSQKVTESTFFSLVQYFAVVLFECNEAEDYTPAKTLMNMCFTFYHEGRPAHRVLPEFVINGRPPSPGVQSTSSGVPHKVFLYSYLKNQPIWQSLRFWNAAFFDAVQNERMHRPSVTRDEWKKFNRDEAGDEKAYQENVTFGQLGTFTCNMRAFGLPKELCMEFLRKQCTIANLKEEQIQMLKENIEMM